MPVQGNGTHPMKREKKPEKLEKKTSKVDKIKQFRVDVNGQISFEEDQDFAEEVTQRTQINALEQWDPEEFMNLEDKKFSFFELCQMLQSSSYHHPSYALRVLQGIAEDKFFIDVLINPEQTQLLELIYFHLSTKMAAQALEVLLPVVRHVFF